MNSTALLNTAEPAIDIPMMKRIVSEIVIKRKKVCMFRGPAGIGKTFAIRQAAEEANALVIEARLGQWDSVDMRGMPDVDKANHSTVWYAPAVLPFKGNKNFPTDRPILLFLDELTSAAPAVFAVCYQLLQDRAIGEHVLMDNVVVCCAGNNDSDQGVVNRIPMPLNNRMLHFQVVVNVNAWCDHMFKRGAAAQFIAYHRWKKTALLKWDTEAAEHPPCYPSPRSWEAATEIYRDYSTDPDFMRINVAAAIGEGEATEFIAFLTIWTKVLTAEQIIKDPTGVPLPAEESLRYATAVSVSGAMTLKNVKPLHKFLTRLDPEYVVMAWQLALTRDNTLFTTDEFLDIGTRYAAIFDVSASRRKAA